MRHYRGNSLVEIDWVGYTVLAVTSGVSATDITLVFDHEHDFDVGLRPTIPSDWALGGCSGAPLLTFVEDAAFSVGASAGSSMNPAASFSRRPARIV